MTADPATWNDRYDLGPHGIAAVCFTGRGVPGSEPDAAHGEAVRAVVPEPWEAGWAQQVHGADVVDGQVGDCGEGDALVTSRADLGLGVITADCVPVLLAGGDRIAAVHAGWRGVAADIVTAAVDRFDSPAVAWIGPAIGVEVYEVGDEVAERVVAASAPEVSRDGPNGRPHVDLRRAVAIQLAAAGVADIRRIGPCTYTASDRLWSHRRESRDGRRAGRNVSAIWRRAEP